MTFAPTLLAEERVELRSVGIDIGSATSHLLFSELTMEKDGSRYVTTSRRVVYESPILLTPYAGATSIDHDALGAFIDEQYHAAGIGRGEVDTGALILTGVALLRDNARGIAEIFALEAGRFVAVSAGDSLEAVMSAHGSGAVGRSARSGARVLNVDIGGGTTKLAVCDRGRVVNVLAIDVGARLLVVDGDGIVVRLEPAGRRVAELLGIPVDLGTAISSDSLDRIGEFMVDAVVSSMPLGAATPRSPLLRAEPLAGEPAVDVVMFSGGVAEYVYERTPEGFGDLGPRLAKGLLRAVGERMVAIERTAVGIRATVVGASQYTAQVSGSTIYLSSPDAVPMRNVPVVAPELELDVAIDPLVVAGAVSDAIARFDLTDVDGPVALAVRWREMATYDRLHALARGIETGLACRSVPDAAVVIVCDDDVGRLIGMHLVEELASARPVVSVDCVVLEDFDFVDIGMPLPGSNVVPVVIKSLMFPDSGAPRPDALSNLAHQ